MRKALGRKQLRELWSEATTAALFTRFMAPLLLRHLIGSLKVEERVQRRRTSSRERRFRRSLRLGAYAVGAVAAAAAAARMAGHKDLLDDIPEIDHS